MLVCKLERELPNSSSGATRKLWRISHAGEVQYVITSAVSVAFTGPETYVFAATEDGEVSDWLELDGSFRGAFDHERAIEGYVESLTEGAEQ